MRASLFNFKKLHTACGSTLVETLLLVTLCVVLTLAATRSVGSKVEQQLLAYSACLDDTPFIGDGGGSASTMKPPPMKPIPSACPLQPAVAVAITTMSYP